MRFYSREFRAQAVRRILAGEKVLALSQELGIHRKLLYEWMRRVNEGGESNLRDRGRPRKTDPVGGDRPNRVTELERMVSQLQLVIEFLRSCLTAAQSAHRRNWRDYRSAIFQTIQAEARRTEGLTVEQMCELANVARSGYYRYLRILAEKQAVLQKS